MASGTRGRLSVSLGLGARACYSAKSLQRPSFGESTGMFVRRAANLAASRRRRRQQRASESAQASTAYTAQRHISPLISYPTRIPRRPPRRKVPALAPPPSRAPRELSSRRPGRDVTAQPRKMASDQAIQAKLAAALGSDDDTAGDFLVAHHLRLRPVRARRRGRRTHAGLGGGHRAARRPQAAAERAPRRPGDHEGRTDAGGAADSHLPLFFSLCRCSVPEGRGSLVISPRRRREGGSPHATTGQEGPKVQGNSPPRVIKFRLPDSMVS